MGQVKNKGLIFLFFLMLYSNFVLAQPEINRIQEIENLLDSFAIENKVNLEEKVSLSMNGSIRELISFLAESSKTNLSVANSVNVQVSNTFSDVSVKDILLYVCEVNQLEVKVLGSILQLRPFQPLPKEKIILPPQISYDGQLLTMNLNGDTLEKVIQKVSELTQKNIAIDPAIRNLEAYGFINQAGLEKAVQQLAVNNNIELEINENFYFLKAKKIEEKQITQTSDNPSGRKNRQLNIRKSGDSTVNVIALDASILEVIEQVGSKLKKDYFILPARNPLLPANTGEERSTQRNRSRTTSNEEENQEDRISIQLKAASFEEVLHQVCKNSNYAFSNENGLFIIGKRQAEGLRETRMLRLKHRSVGGVLDFIPKELLRGVEVDTLMELNSLIMSGAKQNILEIDTLIQTIDQAVPVVMIDLMIVDVQTNKLQEFGVEAGIVDGGKEPGGTIISSTAEQGGIDFSFSTESINDVLSLLAGRNIINLGTVSPNFFLSLKAVEEQGFVEVKSTPKLSTLNSHDASLSIGQKRYYLEQEFAFQGITQPIQVQSNNFREVEANLDIKIRPMVAEDGEVTLDIYFEQSEFLEQPNPNAPPPQVSRRFESKIRVQDGEMIALGGLEQENQSKTKRGVPFFSRIPLIGWMFGKKKKNKSKSKLMVFVRPIVLY